MDDYYLGIVGVDPDKYQWYTYRELEHMASAREADIEITERLEFSLYNTAYGPMGNKIFKASDLKKMFPRLFKEEMIFNPKDANDLIKAHGLVKQ